MSTKLSKKDLLIKFIKDNGLIFDDTDSGLNGNCTIISGFADYLGVSSPRTIKTAINNVFPELETRSYSIELTRVFDFAYRYNYGLWWKRGEAKKMYKF